MANKTKKIDSNVRVHWHVRDENNSVFGPVDFNTLKEWVEDGRVSPLSQLSNDEQKSWSLAVSLVALEMNCVAEIEPGSFYGPIHQRAMAGLVADGSIPAAAIVYRRSVADGSTVSPADPSAIVALHSKCDAATEQVESLQMAKVASEKACAAAKKKLLASKNKIAELEDSVSQLKSDYQERILSLNDHNLDLQSRETQLNKTADSLRSEIDTLRQNVEEQQRVMAEQALIHATELKDKERAFTLRTDNLATEHETAINLIKQEALEVSQLLRKEISVLQAEGKSLRKQCKLVVTQKETINTRVKELEREYERSCDERLVELNAKDIQIEELVLEKEGLTSEIRSLRARNEQLKAEPVRFEEQKAGEKINQSAERKLIVLEQLFIEAANLLRDDAAEESQECVVSESLDSESGPELLEFEEVDPHESLVNKSYAAKKRTEPVARSSERPVNANNSAPASGKEKSAKTKNNKHWPFGSGKRELNHRSLAELEAQAHIELQRLSAKGGDISALFDKNK